MKKSNIVSASLLASDLANFETEIRRCENSGIDWIHYDVMDGHFVEQISYGAQVLKAIRKLTSTFLDVHLMVDNPSRQIPFFADAGADLINIHVESNDDIAACLSEIRRLGKKSAVAVKPKTPVESVYKYLPLCDMVLIMTVEPGYGGQGFIKEMLPKITALREYADKQGFENLDIQVDGGVNAATASSAKQAGANVLVAGTGLFRAENMKSAANILKGN